MNKDKIMDGSEKVSVCVDILQGTSMLCENFESVEPKDIF